MNHDVTILVNSDFSFSNNIIKIGNAEKQITITEINEIKRVLNLKPIQTKKDYFKKILFILNEDNPSVLNFVIEKNNKQKYLFYLKKEIIESKKYLTNYFFDILPERESLIKKIKTLKGCQFTEYDHNTVTGRLKVTGGTNFLTMKEKDRKNLKHLDPTRAMYEIDFKSCEPNFYIKSQNLPIHEKDIYGFIMKKFDLKVSRDKFKRGLLSLMYGANDKTISVISNIKQSKIKEIKSFLKINDFKKSLESEYERLGYIKNFYGRPLLSNNNLVNHWIQSSAADFCCLAFNNFLNENTDVELHGIIHDAIIVSTKKEITLDKIKELRSNIEIPVSIKNLSDN